jgi:hypothetical protein
VATSLTTTNYSFHLFTNSITESITKHKHMKKITKILTTFALLTASSTFLLAQDNEGGKPYSFEQELSDNSIAAVTTPFYDFAPLIKLSNERAKQGTFELTDRLFDVNYTLLNSGTWTNLMNGDRLWKLKIVSPGAKKISLYYQNFYMPEGARLFIYNSNRTEEIGAFTSKNNDEARENDGVFSTDHLSGDTQILEYYEPKEVKGQSNFSIFRVAHQFMNVQINESEPCQFDVVCPDGTNWVNQTAGIVRVYVVIGSNAGYCSGTLINNTAQDCRKLFLTAMHCCLDETTGVETTAYNQWVLYFEYQKTGCATGTASTTKLKTGVSKRAGANDGGGTTGSDFLLVEMTPTSFPTGVTPYFNGWTKGTTVTAGGVGIHHPMGDCKKISTYNTTPTSTTWGGTVNDTHWTLVWQAGHGSTEPGSSGSPLFNSSGLVIGHLTGGGSCCVTNGCPAGSTGTGPTLADSYGKIVYDWSSDGTTTGTQLKSWLDPLNTGATTQAGSFSCSATGVTEHHLDNYVSVYPNPATDVLNVNFELLKSEDATIRVINLLGQEIMRKKLVNTTGGVFQIGLNGFPAGTYVVEITTNTDRAVRKVDILRK